MPLRRPTSPLTLETDSPLASDTDDYGLAGSDDGLDESQRSVQRRRREKLGEAYLQGRPLFILSASLRGPLDRGWVNPWKKDRRKPKKTANDNGPTEQPVIPETDSRRRRNYHSPPANSRPGSSATPQVPSRLHHIKKSAPGIGFGSRDHISGLKVTETGGQSPRFNRPKAADAKWLKKDNTSTIFQVYDPPTSPTTSISSRQLKTKGGSTISQSPSRLPSLEPVRSSAAYQSKHAKQPRASSRPETWTHNISFAERHLSPTANTRKSGLSPVHNDKSLLAVSSSFEYRLRQKDNPTANLGNKSSSRLNGNVVSEYSAASPIEISSNVPEAAGSADGGLARNEQDNEDESLTLIDGSNTIENLSPSHPEAEAASKLKHTTSENNIPSAQPVQGNPPIPDNLTSLYSIAVSKATSNRTEDHNTDQQLSTQVALMMAQKSFQNELRSPEVSPAMSGRKRRMYQGPNQCSPNAANITPFHRINAPDRDIVDRSNAPRTGGVSMISTQYMMDAATPFNFSTEKKTGFRELSLERNMSSKTKKRKTTSFALSPPSDDLSEHSKYDGDDPENITHHQLMHARSGPGSTQSALPLTLTGTTPPTAQEGQGADSFNLSQAIAEAGSWLQQSFEINRDITQCKTTTSKLS
ncbi:hypothetical protein BJX61DRAFT_408851 [Aspergillus egyptiacus]|nr:hypothetical protein BJX61DRAFT_408851 [Aspergillus egyptiacus]